jgi:hypothetical protein
MGKFNLLREPAIILTLVATVVRLLTAHWLKVSPDTQAVVNAFVTAGAGLIVAVWVKHNGAVPALLGFVQAALALGVGSGWNLSADRQALIMSVLGGIAALFARTQVVAPGTPPPLVAGRVS